jgi:hypothetical protein
MAVLLVCAGTLRKAPMTDISVQQAQIVAPFGLRKVAPRACIADKPHLQDFFCEALEEIGFVTCK